MLKIKDSVDLKELEKFGLIKLDIIKNDVEIIEKDVYCYIDEYDKEYITNNCIGRCDVQFFINNKREIDFCAWPEMLCISYILEKIYDLTKADIIEK